MCARAGIILSAIYAAVLLLNASPSAANAASSPDSTPAGSTSALGSDIKLHFDLPAGPMDKALRDFAVQANRNISYEPSIVAGLQAAAIKGEFTVGDALSLLLKGTKLRAVDINTKTIRILENTSTGTSLQTVPGGPSSNDGETHNKNGLDEITVTGTHIRGTKNSPSPVLVFTRDDIDATGANTLQQFLQSLPQNFGGASENTIGSIAAKSQTNNTVNGSAPNLRGLGADATLVLIDGHRVAPGNSDGSFVDISMIPLTAIERVEIVTDGASAIYGADAVGGVVNIILRGEFNGVESRVQYGSVTTGTMHDIQVGQTVGHDWTDGSGVLSYQYADQTPLSAASRDYLQGVLLPFDLLPQQVQNAAFANIHQEVSSGFDLNGDAMYSRRSTDSAQTVNDVPYGSYSDSEPSQINSYGASFGSTVRLAHQSELKLLANYSESDTTQQTYETPPADAPLQSVLKTKSALMSLDANLDGILTTIPAGPVHYAIGAQYRRESFGNTYLFPPTDNTFYPRRNVDGGYLELHIPVVKGGSPGGPALELTMADRAEHYSDFGGTNNPQVGVIWKPVSDLAIRGTYGTSFKAPTLSELNPVPTQVVLVPGSVFSPAPGGTPNALSVDGGNPNLKPEKATTWTAGLDFKSSVVDGLTAKLTFYNIVFKDEIVVASQLVSLLNQFADENVLGPEIVQRNPPRSLIEGLISEPTYLNPYNVDPATIGAVLDNSSLNLSTAKTRGLDFGVGYSTNFDTYRVDTGIDGTYIFAFDNQFSSSAPVTSFLNTTYNPIDLKFRAKTIVTRGPWSTGVYVNFINSYRNTNVTPNGHVPSWTTADAIVSYEFGTAGIPFRGVSATLSVVNLANRAPPYVPNADALYSPIAYDGANANALGRYVSLLLQKRW
jgi:outer membrane receptor protein involved in Fe transport